MKTLSRFRAWATDFRKLLILVTGVAVTIVVSGCADPESSDLLPDVDTDTLPEARTDEAVEKDPQPLEISETGPWPKVVAEERDFNFGRMAAGTRMHHEFAISNAGEAPLRLRVHRTSCKCTQFRVSHDVLAPGESGSVFLEWEGRDVTDAFHHAGDLYTNDPDNPEIRFSVTGQVAERISLKPDTEWSLGLIRTESPQTMETLLFSRFLPTLTVTSVVPSSDLITVEHEPMTELELTENDAVSGLKFRVTVRPLFPAGDFREQLAIHIAEVNDPVTVAISARRHGAIRITGMKGVIFDSGRRRLSLGQFPALRGRSAELMLLVDQKQMPEPLRLEGFESSPAGFRAELRPQGKPAGGIGRYVLKIEYPPGALKMQRGRNHPGQLKCFTNHPKEPEILISVTFSAN